MSATSTISKNFQIETIIRYESGLLASQTSQSCIADKFMTMDDFYLLASHQDKLMNAAKRISWPVQLIELYSGTRGLQILFAKLLLHIHQDKQADGPLQVLVALAKDGTLNIRSSPALTPGLLSPTDLFDRRSDPTVKSSGDLYTRAPVQVLIDDQVPLSSGTLWPSSIRDSSFDEASTADERLIVSQYNEVLQGRFTTPYFLRNGVWITPAYSGVVAESVTRRYALEYGLCKEGIVLKSSLKDGEHCWLSDAVRGFFQGTICLRCSTSHGSWPEAHSNHNDKTVSERDDGVRIKGERKSAESADKGPDHEDDDEDDDELQIISNPFISSDAPQAVKRPNPFASSSSSPPVRRSKRGQPGFTPLILTDNDRPLFRDYKTVPNPEHGGRILRPRSRRPLKPA